MEFPEREHGVMNQLQVNRQHPIVALFEQGWSRRRIARELGLDRATVRKYLAASAAKPPIPLTGLGQAEGSKSPPAHRVCRCYGGITTRLAHRPSRPSGSGQFV